MYAYTRRQDCINGNTHKENERSLPLTRDRPDLILYTVGIKDSRFIIIITMTTKIYINAISTHLYERLMFQNNTILLYVCNYV